MYVIKYFFISTLLLLSNGLTDEAPHLESKLAQVVYASKLPLSCQTKLIRIADEFIGQKKHRILEHAVSDSAIFHIFILLSYNDQDSHLSYTVIPSKNDDCQINMNESFELPATCPDARQSIFKRWAMLGRLDDRTIVVRHDHPRKKSALLADKNARAMGFLTQTRRGKACLISRQQQNIPTPPNNKE